MEIFGIILSFIAIGFSLFTYFKHDLRIKQQAARLNKYQIEKIDKEKEEQRKAIIEANVKREEKGTITIKIYNKGKSLAKGVNVLIPDVEGLHVINNPCPIDIRPQNGIDILLAATIDRPDKIEIQFRWQDDFLDDNFDFQTIQL